ncbi:MAG: cupin domain-containing protein [Arenicellales bacterium]|nr:cupin domain-containing protein [Arenicellales bacterium]MDC0979263.1 cupin domain-containing protein [Gammaproteobacteria bacterium]MDC1073178.1 cupin domain-containing protein [Gammaproteobacteria bacterium]MDC1098139.1 cupin domain-containing protein [Gammaproteobacteria bacterium]MDG1193734.1 cupin domain-containing protein [Arenicellales bacterium]
MASYIFSAEEVESNSDFFCDRKLHGALVATGQSCQLLWAKFEPGGTYGLHSHPHEQMSVMISGRMRLTVGDEVRDIGPGDMWFAPANVDHGGEILGDQPVVFIDVYAPPADWIAKWIEDEPKATRP